MRKKAFLGLDTSNYTTSLALVSESGELIANLKRPLTVKEGERGLRQSDACFLHIKNIPEIMAEAKKILESIELLAVAVSTRPRNVENSYMPCFLVGESIAEGIAATSGLPIYKFSHQCGHIMAAVFSSGADSLLGGEFSALHISGGTTEILRVRGGERGFYAELVGGTADLSAGQLIDRIGVHLGLSFPAGSELEKLALMNSQPVPKKKIPINDFKINLSGIENVAKKLYEDTNNKPLVADFVLSCVEEAISALCKEYVLQFGNSPFLFAGGVMSNSIIKNKLKGKFDAYFAEPALSADNAVGIAELARRCYASDNK